MKRYFFIVFSVLSFFLFCSKSCNSPEEEERNSEEARFKKTLDSLDNSLTNAILTDQALRAFEMKAGQSLSDFADYLEILADRSADESFRMEAEMRTMQTAVPANGRYLWLRENASG